MLKIMKELWDKNQDKLRTELSSRDDLNECSYVDLVKIAFDKIYNDDSRLDNENLFIDRVHEIDDGDYQGTLIYLIPFNSYQPDPEDYRMTFAWYGSRSGCDALQSAQSWGDGKLTEQQVKDFMSICKDLICNAIKPYNYGWRHDDRFDVVEEGDNSEQE